MAPPDKAYKNLDFLNSPHARPIRILCEYEEPRQRFIREGVDDTIVFFGSARASRRRRRRQLAHAQNDSSTPAMTTRARCWSSRSPPRSGRPPLALLRRHPRAARRLTEWDLNRQGGRRYLVCTGGGPGIMEAANRGPWTSRAGARRLGISLPFEEKVNTYVPDELAFEFHYFFTRKYWFLYLVKAMVLMPGGFGTMDELFETLTLRQTGKIKKPVPTVLFGSDYWDSIFNLDAMVEWGTIAQKDLLMFHRSDTVDDAFDYLVDAIETLERTERLGPAEQIERHRHPPLEKPMAFESPRSSAAA